MDDALPSWLDEVASMPDEEVLPRLLTRTQARSRGIGPDAVDYRVRVGRWQRLAPAVYLTAPAPTPVDRARAAVLHGGRRAMVSGAARLRLLRFRSITAVCRELVLVPLRSGIESWGRIHVRRTARLPVAAWEGGVSVAPVARAIADHVLDVRTIDGVRSVVAEGVQRGLCTPAQLSAELAAGPRRGSGLFRRALCEVGLGARSVPEARAGQLLRAACVPEFEQNAEVFVGDRRFVADVFWRRQRAILEIDSTEYHLSPADHDATLRRDQLLQMAGYAVLHVKPSQLRDAVGFVALVRTWLAAVSSRAEQLGA